MPNPFWTREDWRKKKTTYGIPDAVLKYSIGEKMQKLHDDYEKAAPGRVTKRNAPAALKVLSEGFSAITAIKNGLNQYKDQKKIKDKAGALKQLTELEKLLTSAENACKGATDEFANSRDKVRKAEEYLKLAKEHPDVAEHLERCYGQGMRNDLGSDFNKFMAKYPANKEVENLLIKYKGLMEKWYAPMLQQSAEKTAKDPGKRKEFIEDMEDALATGKAILEKTK